MPIFNQQNNNPNNEELWYDVPESAVVHLGFGDVFISTAKRPVSEGGYVNELLFTESEPHPIGEWDDRAKGRPCHAPVVLRFDKIESVDVLIERLETLKKEWDDEPAAPTAKLIEGESNASN